MTTEEKVFLTLIGPESVMQSLEKNVAIEGVSIGKPQPLDAMVDAVDTSLGPDEIKMFMEFATAVLSLTGATLEFILALQHGLSAAEGANDPRIIIVDARTNTQIVSITSDTDPQWAKQVIETSWKK